MVCGDLALEIHVGCARVARELAISVAGPVAWRLQSISTSNNLRLELRDGAIRLAHDTVRLRTRLK